MRRKTAAAAVLHAALLIAVSPVRSAWAGPPELAAAARALAALAAGGERDLLVLVDPDPVEAEAEVLRSRGGLRFDDRSVLDLKARRFVALKAALRARAPLGEADILRDYRHLPVSLVRFRSERALKEVLAAKETAAVYEDAEIRPHLARSLPFIGQPPLSVAGVTGTGEGVAVIDTGIDYTLAGFGSCTAPGAPAGCRVAASVDVTGNGVILNRSAGNHGTNVSGIVAATAPGASILSVNAFHDGSSKISWILAGIDWVIANREAYRISVINMSLGDGGSYTSPCDRRSSNPFLASLEAARSVGILPVASSGNSALSGAMASPACTPGVVSVGAVYDASWGGPYGWTVCSDPAASAPDRIPCFSNSASFLTMLAPGAFVTAGGVQLAGTSQAAPHVAAAAAVLRSAHPGDTLDQTVARLTGTGVPVTDPRNGLAFPRLDLNAALGPPDNDDFAARAPIEGDDGSVAGNNIHATVEADEPAHGGQGGSSVWWSWRPSRSGLAIFDSTGSSFGTLASVYTGTSLTGLTRLAAASGTAALVFPVQQGSEYLIAVDGEGGGSGGILLTHTLSLAADLRVELAPPGAAQAGKELALNANIANSGPSAATGVVLVLSLPLGVRVVSAPDGCTIGAGAVTCGMADLAPGEGRGVPFLVVPEAAGPLQVRLEVSSAIADPDFSGNAATLDCAVAPAPAAVPGLSGWGVVGCALFMFFLLGTKKPRPA